MDIVKQMRSFESDHEPDGWPAVTMGQISALCDEIDRLNVANDQITKAQIDNYKLATDAWDSNKLLREESASLQSIIKTACNSLPVAFSPDEKTGENLISSIDAWRKHAIDSAFSLANKANKFEESSNRYFSERNKLSDEVERLQSIIDELQKRFMNASVDRNLLQGVINEQQSLAIAVPSPRITEQDAGEILLSYGVEYIGILQWLKDKGRSTIAKLNEAKHD